MPSRPAPFDDGERYDTVDALADVAEPEPPAADNRGTDASGRGPNYLFRRAVVVGGVVAVIATAAIVVGNLIGTGGTTTVSGAIEAEWNRIVQIDERLGRVIVQNEQGEELERIPTAVRSAIASAVVGPTALLVDGDTVSSIDLDSSSAVDVDFAADRITTPSGSALTLVASDSGGQRGLLVHAPTGDVVDTTEFAPISGSRYQFEAARATPSGRDVLVTDTGNFQSVLFSFDRAEPSFFPGLALAVGDDVVVTAQNVGTEATVNTFQHDGQPVSSGRTASVRAAIIGGDVAQLITVDGEIVEMNLVNGDTSDGEQLDIGTIESGHVWTSGDRLVVTGTDGTAVVTESGNIVTTIDGAAPFDTAALTRGRCLIVDTAGVGSGGDLTMIDVTDGEVVAESERTGGVSSSADGCTALVTTSPTVVLLDASGATPVDVAGGVIALAPDATAFVDATAGRLVLVSLAEVEQRADDVDLGPDGRAIMFTEL